MDGLYAWVDGFEFSRPKRQIARDFSDAALLAELLAQLHPAYVQLHNYPSTHRLEQKLSNWETLNRKVLRRIKCEIALKHQEDLAHAMPGSIEVLLLQIKKQSERGQQNRSRALTKSTFSSATKHGTYTQYVRSNALKAAGYSQTPRNRGCLSETGDLPNNVEESPTSDKSKRIRGAGQSPGILPAPYVPQQRPKKPSMKAFQPEESIASSFSRILNSISKSSRQDAQIQPASPPRPHVKPINPSHCDRSSSKDLPVRKQGEHETVQTPGQTHSPLNKTPSAAIISSIKCLKTGVSEHSSFVYFTCLDGSNLGPPVVPLDDPRENVQVGCIVRSLASGDCVVQLFKCVSSELATKTKAYVPTEHWIECCGSQLHNIQNMSFHQQSQTWQWRPAAALPFVPSRRVSCAMKATRPESYSYQVVSRIVCSLIDVASPVCIKQIYSSNASLRRLNDWTPSPELFAVPLSPTLFPTVRVPLPAGLTRQQFWRTRSVASWAWRSVSKGA